MGLTQNYEIFFGKPMNYIIDYYDLTVNKYSPLCKAYIFIIMYALLNKAKLLSFLSQIVFLKYKSF